MLGDEFEFELCVSFCTVWRSSLTGLLDPNPYTLSPTNALSASSLKAKPNSESSPQSPEYFVHGTSGDSTWSLELDESRLLCFCLLRRLHQQRK